VSSEGNDSRATAAQPSHATGIARLRAGLHAFDQRGEFSSDDLAALKAAIGPALPRTAQTPELLDGLLGVFFERHVLADARRAELLALDDEGLVRAVRHRFRQLLAEDHPDRTAWRALAAHVREALASPDSGSTTSPGFPLAIREGANFSAAAVAQAVRALGAERGRTPTVAEATGELLQRYVAALAQSTSASREFPELIRAQLDAQRLALTVLELLNADERDLLRYVLEGEGSIEAWGVERGISRATAYRLLARLKALCKVEWRERSSGTRLEILEALRVKLQGD
jgi:transcriptional regulator of acetoin/glycerol metabolism